MTASALAGASKALFNNGAAEIQFPVFQGNTPNRVNQNITPNRLLTLKKLEKGKQGGPELWKPGLPQPPVKEANHNACWA